VIGTDEGAHPWFEPAEYHARLARVQAALRVCGADALIAFQPESVTWITGFFTRGYATLQFALVPADGEPSVFCRDVARYYLDRTCVFSDHGTWSDGEDRMAAAAAFLGRRLGRAARVVAELDAWQCSAARHAALAAALPGLRLEDANGLVAKLRLVKSPAEITYQRAAGRAAEAGMCAAAATARAGVTEREVAAEIVAAMIRAGSDHPGPGPLSSGERAFHLHGGFTDRVLRRGDTLQCECTPAVRHHHARFMRTIKIGHATAAERARMDAIIAVQNAALAEVRPGTAAAVPDGIYRRGILSRGLRKNYTNKTFYSIGLMFPPVGGEALEAAPDSAWTFEEGMVFHTYVLADSFGFSETIAVTAVGHERLTCYPRELVVTP
jgi:Xaa-Pro dipeptidase